MKVSETPGPYRGIESLIPRFLAVLAFLAAFGLAVPQAPAVQSAARFSNDTPVHR